MTFSSIRDAWYSRLLCLCLIATFMTTMLITPRAAHADVLGLPQPGAMVDLSSAYVPLMITGMTIHPENPLLLDFIVSTGNSGLNAQQVKVESDRLIKYFLACLTIPENNQWVNLSPYEKQRIIPEDLGQTILGRDMLAEDYLLKQLTASLIYPERNLGKDFWNRVYAKASEMYGNTQVPVNTFNKVWILPDTAKVYEHKDTVFVVKSHLKVMLDKDYLSLSRHAPIAAGAEANPSKINDLGAQMVRQIILPAIEQEVNTGKNFTQLRQIYNSMILAVWFKKNLRQALLNQVYTDKSKVNGVNVDDPAIKEKIYRQYLEAYKKGVFNYIKEDLDQSTQQVIPRKYFSGGLTPVDAAMLKPATVDEAMAALNAQPESRHYRISGLTEDASRNLAMATSHEVSLANVSRNDILQKIKGRLDEIQNEMGGKSLFKDRLGLDYYFYYNSKSQSVFSQKMSEDMLRGYIAQLLPENGNFDVSIKVQNNNLGTKVSIFFKDDVMANLNDLLNKSDNLVSRMQAANAITAPTVSISRFVTAEAEGTLRDYDRELLAFLPKANELAVTLKIGGTSIASSVLNSDGEFTARTATEASYDGKRSNETFSQFVSRSVPEGMTEDGFKKELQNQVLDRMTDQIVGLLVGLGNDRDKVKVIGISSPGPLAGGGADRRGIFSEDAVNLPFPKGFSLSDALEARLEERGYNIPVETLHDGVAGAEGERSRVGTVPNGRNFSYWIWGTGIGGATIVNGKLFLGQSVINNLLGEFGHHMVRFPDGHYEWVAVRTQGKNSHSVDSFFNGYPDVEDYLKGPVLAQRYGVIDPSKLNLKQINEVGREMGHAIGSFLKAIHAQYGIILDNVIIGSGVSHLGEPLQLGVNEGIKEELNRPLEEEWGYREGLSRTNGDLLGQINRGEESLQDLNNKFGAKYVVDYLAAQHATENVTIDKVVSTAKEVLLERSSRLILNYNINESIPLSMLQQLAGENSGKRFNYTIVRNGSKVIINISDAAMAAAVMPQLEEKLTGIELNDLPNKIYGMLTRKDLYVVGTDIVIVKYNRRTITSFYRNFTQGKLAGKIFPAMPSGNNAFNVSFNYLAPNGKKPTVIVTIRNSAMLAVGENKLLHHGTVNFSNMGTELDSYSVQVGDGFANIRNGFTTIATVNSENPSVNIAGVVFTLIKKEIHVQNNSKRELGLAETGGNMAMLTGYEQTYTDLDVFQLKSALKRQLEIHPYAQIYYSGREIPFSAIQQIGGQENRLFNYTLIQKSDGGRSIELRIEDASSPSESSLDKIGADEAMIQDENLGDIQKYINTHGIEEAIEYFGFEENEALSFIKNRGSEELRFNGKDVVSQVEKLRLQNLFGSAVFINKHLYKSNELKVAIEQLNKLNIGDLSAVYVSIEHAVFPVLLITVRQRQKLYVMSARVPAYFETGQAVAAHPTNSLAEKGGIDLNSRSLKMQSEGQGVNITFDPAMIAQFKRGDFSGVKIKILDVVPVNLMPLLGLKEDEQPA